MTTQHDELTAVLEQSLSRAEKAFLEHEPPHVSSTFANNCDLVFGSKTQAYREVLVGCLLARIQDKTKAVRLPYVKLGANAFSGRSLDERVVNPFLRAKSIPSSKGPYLSVFRRSVRFDESTEAGLKDQSGYRAFLGLLSAIEREENNCDLLGLLDYVLYRFVLLREEARVGLIEMERISLTQYKRLIDGLLSRPSGGFFPVLLVACMIEAVNRTFSLGWQVEHQDINVADRAAGVPGDITIRRNGSAWLSIEVTERSVDSARVTDTFKDKIAPMAVHDYVFLVHVDRIDRDAQDQAERYFAQGYDVNFVDIGEWLFNTLVTVGRDGRKQFQARLIEHLRREEVTTAVKVAWNEEIEKLTA
jgi:hypothetical protein